MADAAKLKIEDQELDLPMIVGTEQETALDISKLRATSGCITLDEGYVNTGSTTISSAPCSRARMRSALPPSKRSLINTSTVSFGRVDEEFAGTDDFHFAAVENSQLTRLRCATAADCECASVCELTQQDSSIKECEFAR